MRLLLILTALIALFSCSPEKRLSRLLKHHPQLIKTDTVWRADTVTVAGAKADTIFKFFNRDTTVVIREKQLTMKYIYNSKDSTIILKGECDTVTVIRKVPVQVNTVTPVASISWWDRWLPWIVIAIIGIILLKKR